MPDTTAGSPRVTMLELGEPRGGIARYTRMVAAALRDFETMDVVTAPVRLENGGVDTLLRLRRAIGGADVLVAPSSANGLWAPRWLGLVQQSLLTAFAPPLILDLHDVYGHDIGRAAALGRAALLRKSSVVLTHAEQDRLPPGLSPKAAFVPHFIEERRLPAREHARQRHGLEADELVVVALGWIHPRKRYELAIDIVASLDVPARLWCLGAPVGNSGEYVEVLRQHAERVGLGERLLVTGYLPESALETRLAAADVGLCPYASASASGSLSTLLGARVPVLASDIPTVREYAQQAREAVRVVAGDDVVAWRQALEALHAHRPSRTAFDQPLRERSPAATARRYATAIATALERPATA